MATFGLYSQSNLHRASRRNFVATLVLAAFLCPYMPASTPTGDVSGQVSVTHSGFGRSRTNGVWTATLTVKNTSTTAISGPVQVVLTKLPSNVTMVNKAGVRNGDPYVIASAGTLAAGASVSVMIQFTNPSNGFIDFTPVTYSGT
jgi:hypothetical protein